MKPKSRDTESQGGVATFYKRPLLKLISKPSPVDDKRQRHFFLLSKDSADFHWFKRKLYLLEISFWPI